MNQNAYQGIPGLPSPSSKDHTPYIDLIVKAADWPQKQFGASRVISEPFADFIIYISFLVSETEWYIYSFTKSQESAARFYRDLNTYWRAIALGVLTPEVERVVLLCLPNLDRGKYFQHTTTEAALQGIPPQDTPTTKLPTDETPEETEPGLHLVKKPFSLKIAMRLCEAWRLDERWEKLTPCAKLLFYYLIFRTYRKDTIRKIKRAITRGETFFPWCLTGLHSLEKQLTYQPRSSTRIKHYKSAQIRRALRQLWDLALIDRVFRGYEGQGPGKYHVFRNPDMSARFYKTSIEAKREAALEKRLSRMS